MRAAVTTYQSGQEVMELQIVPVQQAGRGRRHWAHHDKDDGSPRTYAPTLRFQIQDAGHERSAHSPDVTLPEAGSDRDLYQWLIQSFAGYGSACEVRPNIIRIEDKASAPAYWNSDEPREPCDRHQTVWFHVTREQSRSVAWAEVDMTVTRSRTSSQASPSMTSSPTRPI